MQQLNLKVKTVTWTMFLIAALSLAGCTAADFFTLTEVDASDLTAVGADAQRLAPSYYQDDPTLIGVTPGATGALAQRLSPSYYLDDPALIYGAPAGTVDNTRFATAEQ